MTLEKTRKASDFREGNSLTGFTPLEKDAGFRERNSLTGFTICGAAPAEFEDFLEKNGFSRYRGRQILDWIYKKRILSFKECPGNIPGPLKDFLRGNCRIFACEVVKQQVSKRDSTTKFLLRLDDGLFIEAVLLYASGGRLTACLSAQAGCAVGCVFCASGKAGFKRNLTAAEIVSQYVLIRQKALGAGCAAANIVFMGVGEPLLNYNNLIAAIDILTDSQALGIAARRITISTAGVIEAIRRLAGYKKQVNLSISLHSAIDEKRSILVPLNKKYNIKNIICAVKDYIQTSGRMVTFEYVLIKGINDSRQDADLLGKLLKGIFCKVNVIPYNPVEGLDFKTPSAGAVAAFTKELARNELKWTSRFRKGCDISSACGQLRAGFIGNEK